MKTSIVFAFALLFTGVCITSNAASGSIHFTGAEVSQALQLYRDLTGLKLVIDSRVGKIGHTVTIKAGVLRKEEAAKLIEKALLEQTGTVITRLDQERASVTYNDALPITRSSKASTNKQSGNPAGAVDGGVSLQSGSERSCPAATDPRCWPKA